MEERHYTLLGDGLSHCELRKQGISLLPFSFFPPPISDSSSSLSLSPVSLLSGSPSWVTWGSPLLLPAIQGIYPLMCVWGGWGWLCVRTPGCAPGRGWDLGHSFLHFAVSPPPQSDIWVKCSLC